MNVADVEANAAAAMQHPARTKRKVRRHMGRGNQAGGAGSAGEWMERLDPKPPNVRTTAIKPVEVNLFH